MDENLMGKIQEVLSDPESMQQIAELAQMFQSGGEPPLASASQWQGATAGDNAAKAGGSSPESTFSKSQPASLPLGGIDPGMLLKMGELMNSSGSSDKNTALLLALRPHLGEQRQQRIDKALRLLKLWTVFQTMQKTGMLQQLL